MDLADAKQRICDEVASRRELLIDVSRRIHDHPELGYEEHQAHDLLTGALEDAGLETVRHAHGLDTAFTARAGTDGPEVAVLCEYDALPGLGHACGHNLIAAAGLGAGLAAAAVAEELGGRIRVIGTPAEEGGGGKVRLLEAGAFEGLDAALIIHPADRDLRRISSLAIHQLAVTYRGRAAHAAAAPHEGRNALDAAVLGYMNVAALRQHLRSDERIHGVFTDGGDKPNIVPARAAALWYVRAGTVARREALEARVLACLQAGADAAGCEMEVDDPNPAYAEVRDNEPLLDLFCANAAVLGREVAEPSAETAVMGSTDMGNVSYEVPSIHPMLAVAPPGVAIHTTEFAGCAASEPGDAAVLDGASAMAMTVADLWLRPEALASVRDAFGTQIEAEPPAEGG